MAETDVKVVVLGLEGAIPVDDIVDLYREGGWWDESWTTEGIEPLVRGSFVFTLALSNDTGEIVGMGRALSDGVSDAYIQDVVVRKACRGLHYGRAIVRKLIDTCMERGIGWLALIGEPGTEGFYRPLGFKRMVDYVPLKWEGYPDDTGGTNGGDDDGRQGNGGETE